jgi:hypothetical protein
VGRKKLRRNGEEVEGAAARCSESTEAQRKKETTSWRYAPLRHGLAYNLSLLTIDRVREGVGVAEPDAVRDKDAELAVDAASGAKLTVSPLTAPPCAP